MPVSDVVLIALVLIGLSIGALVLWLLWRVLGEKLEGNRQILANMQLLLDTLRTAHLERQEIIAKIDKDTAARIELAVMQAEQRLAAVVGGEVVVLAVPDPGEIPEHDQDEEGSQ